MSLLNSLKSRVRHALAGIGRGPVSGLIFHFIKRPGGEEVPVSVHMLVSSKTWHAGVLAAASLEFHSGRRWPLFIHEDGSVTEPDRKEIERRLPGVRFVTREEADLASKTALRDHAKCLSHRGRHNLFLKFFDAMPFAPQDRFIVLDSDVIFFRKPREILDWVDSGSTQCHYNEDTKEKFCIPRGEIEKALPVKLLPRFNSGLVLMQKAAINWDLAENLLSTFEATAHAPQFFEQTLYALMASTNPGGGSALPKTYNISWGYWRDAGSICRHYVGDFKHDLLYIEGAPLLLASLLTRPPK